MVSENQESELFYSGRERATFWNHDRIPTNLAYHRFLTLHRMSALTTSTVRARTLTERPIDVLYLAYFGIHLVASLAIDAQLTYPPYSQRLFPKALRNVLQDYLTTSRDPFLLAAQRRSSDHVWFRVLLASETVFQIPCFVVALWGLWKGEFVYEPSVGISGKS